jgi:hypothetical protein
MPSPRTTFLKREREQKLKQKARDKEARRAQKKADRVNGPPTDETLPADVAPAVPAVSGTKLTP